MSVTEEQLATEQAGLERKLDTTEAESTRLRGEEARLLGEKTKALEQPTKDAAASAQALSTAAEAPPPESEAAKMEFKPQHLSADEVNKFSWGLIAMALVGGATAKGNWMGVSSSLKGAMEGILKGDKDRSDQAYEDFKRKFDVAQKHDAEANEKMRTVLENRSLSLNAKIQQIRLLADEYDVPDMKIAAEIKSLDAMSNQLQSHIERVEGMRVRMDTVDQQMQMQMDRLRAQYAPVELDENAKRVYTALNQVTGGKSDLLKPLNSRYGRATATPLFQKMVDDALATNPNMTPEQLAADMTQNAVKYQGVNAAYRQGLQRQTAVERLTLTVRSMEEKVIQAAKDVGLKDSVALNATLNSIRKQFGDGPYQKLKTEMKAVARQYIEAVTMPGSNAQMHASAQDTADTLINENMPISAIIGAFEGMNEEIDITGGNLGKINDNLLKKLGAGDIITFPNQGTPDTSNDETSKPKTIQWSDLPP